MICKICGKDITEKFYLHLNKHKTNKTKYFEIYPEQIKEFEEQKPCAWNKGLTAIDNLSVAKYTESIKKYSQQDEVRKERSLRLKERYLSGDIVSPETRSRIIKNGSDGWVKKIKNANFEERREYLKNFSAAGNATQEENRKYLTPEDYNRLYPFSKGVARYYNCDFCNKQMIAWFGGKPRPNKRFCNTVCWHDYQLKNPFYIFSKNASLFYSQKMQTEFCLRSKLEIWFANVLEKQDKIWSTTPFYIHYEWLGKYVRYYPDFFVNNKYLIELKSNYVRSLQGEERTIVKLKSAEEYCRNNNIQFLYWQFDQKNMTEKIFLNDQRVQNFLQNLTKES